jgi:hypothetical protein
MGETVCRTHTTTAAAAAGVSQGLQLCPCVNRWLGKLGKLSNSLSTAAHSAKALQLAAEAGQHMYMIWTHNTNEAGCPAAATAQCLNSLISLHHGNVQLQQQGTLLLLCWVPDKTQRCPAGEQPYIHAACRGAVRAQADGIVFQQKQRKQDGEHAAERSVAVIMNQVVT